MIANEKQTQIQKSEGLILRGSHLLSNSLVPRRGAWVRGYSARLHKVQNSSKYYLWPSYMITVKVATIISNVYY